jgi:hypothetical protein
MIEELSIVARARMRQTNGHSGGPGPSRRPRRSPRQAIARAACRLGGAMVRVGRQLECYEVNLLGDTTILKPAKAQIK